MDAAIPTLEPREVAALLQAMSAAVAAEVSALPESALAWHPAPSEWFQDLRADSVALVSRLADSDLARGGTHQKVGYIRVQDLLHEWLHHDRNHFRQLQANIQAFVWPNMGNCQRFVGE